MGGEGNIGYKCLPKGPVCEWVVCAGSMSVCVWLHVLCTCVCVSADL